jgi:hypothetical protein
MRVTAALLASALLALSSPLLFGFSRTSHLRFFPSSPFPLQVHWSSNSGLQLWHISLRFVPHPFFFSTAVPFLSTCFCFFFQLPFSSIHKPFQRLPHFFIAAQLSSAFHLHLFFAQIQVQRLLFFTFRQVFFDVKFNRPLPSSPFPSLNSSSSSASLFHTLSSLSFFGFFPQRSSAV